MAAGTKGAAVTQGVLFPGRIAARGCAAAPRELAGRKHDSTIGAITRSVESKNSKSWGVGRLGTSEKGKDDSSKTTC